MFERYTEGARRVIFFARYEAAQTGSPYIETGHLLLGILREGAPFFRELGITEFQPIADDCRKALGSPGHKLSTSVDLPLSNASKSALAYASEEAERLRSKPIALQHLTMGLLRTGDPVTSEILQRHGITLEKLRRARSYEPAGLTAAAGVVGAVPAEFMCDNKSVANGYVAPAMPWPRVGESIFLGKEDSPQAYTVVDIRHFYAVAEDHPENEPVLLQKIVIMLQPGKRG
jgi:ATP-dependent Clp protease ATP-binding subunit ClpC